MPNAHFEPLVGLDTWFLYGERHEAPLHIGATYIFEGAPEIRGGRGALGLSRTVEERLHLVPRYRQKLMWRPGNVGNPVWVDDPDFDLSFHIRRAALPSPGDDATLRDYTARVFARPLDLDKPLWEMTVVEGLTEGRVAVVGEAMSRWLFDRGEIVPEAMRVFAPVSVRDESQRYALGNLVSAMVVDVPLAPMLPRDRMQMVTAATGDLKRSRAAVAARTLTQLANWAPATVQGLAGRVMTAQLRSSQQSVVNLVATNIPGPQIPFYTGGAKLIDVWPFVSIYHSLGLNIAIVSYDGAMSFGLLADRDLVPDLDDFARHLEQTVSDYRDSALGGLSKPRSRTARPRKQAAKKAVRLRVDEEAGVASPNRDGRDVRPQAAAKVHHV